MRESGSRGSRRVRVEAVGTPEEEASAWTQLRRVLRTAQTRIAREGELTVSHAAFTVAADVLQPGPYIPDMLAAPVGEKLAAGGDEASSSDR